MDNTTDNYSKKLNLYNQARDAYYGDGNQIMTDNEFDQLEAELGLENKSELGYSRNGSYTVEHPIIMGSLSKIQIKKDKSGNIDWKTYSNEAVKYLLNTGTGNTVFEVTPKLDGVSFEMKINYVGDELPNDYMPVISTRGNGHFGKDITSWMDPDYFKQQFSGLNELYKALVKKENQCLIIRGEILVNKNIFAQQYASEFTNPRSFVAGMVGTDWELTDDNIAKRKDLVWMCYDYRFVYIDEKHNTQLYNELGWQNQYVNVRLNDWTSFYNVGEQPEPKVISNFAMPEEKFAECFQSIYDFFEDTRNNYDYALDGFVLKPMTTYRKFNPDRERPVDCVAIKFLPMIEKTIIKDIQWEQGKTGELYPVGIVENVVMDGKNITKVSLHNYGKVCENGTGIGAEILVSLAGDIIPFVYEVVKPVEIPVDFEEQNKILNLPDDISYTAYNGHLMSEITDKVRFVNSGNALNIFGIGPAIVEELYELTESRYTNILSVLDEEHYSMILNNRGESQSTSNIIDNLRNFSKTVTLEDIIISMCYNSCGKRCTTKCAEYLKTGKANFAHMPEKAYSWVFDKESDMYKTVMQYVLKFNINMENEEPTNNSVEQIPIIMTGDTSNTQYTTKKDWLKAHPQYIETTSWAECKILFTNDLNSDSSKMKKALKKNIQIKIYDD
jgi:DNA ligase (NAD+)